MSNQPQAPLEPRTGSVAASLRNTRRFRILGLTPEQVIKYFFQGNAGVAVLVLVLILVFLFREGAGFFGQNLANLRIYRAAGLEYVDLFKSQLSEHTALTRRANAIRLERYKALMASGKTAQEANAELAEFDKFSGAFSDAATPLRGVVSDLTETATSIKQRDQIYRDTLQRKSMLVAAAKKSEADAVVATPVDLAKEVEILRLTFPIYKEANQKFSEALVQSLQMTGARSTDAGFEPQLAGFRDQAQAFVSSFGQREQEISGWRADRPIAWYRSLGSFLFGREWITASFWQDFYGIVPLLVGSILVSVIALFIAVPLGLSAAIYVSELAGPAQKNLIKPAIEFISAIPSVVLGFFGVAVLGQALRALSQWPALSWVPGCPMTERLNALTAGCLLAFMAIPTIFSLAEDALNNVPRHFKEASFALGATRLQTIVRILVPASLSGILSAVLLGFGRVIGETMVVLLCAGNRIAIPDFTSGLGTFFQPVHTMTGIIAQEMGEVGPGTIHYRALFMVGLILFGLTLGINVVAQRVVQRYRISIG